MQYVSGYGWWVWFKCTNVIKIKDERGFLVKLSTKRSLS